MGVTGDEIFKRPVPDSGNHGTRCGTKLLYFIVVMIVNLEGLSGNYRASLNISRTGTMV